MKMQFLLFPMAFPSYHLAYNGKNDITVVLFLLFLFRLRHLKVLEGSCNIDPVLKTAVEHCYAPYNILYEDRRNAVPKYR